MFFDRIRRPVAGTVLVTFLALVLQPLSVLAQDRPGSAASRRAAESGEEKYSRTLNEIHEILKEVAPQAAMPHMFPAKPGEMDLRAIGPNMRIEVERAKPAAGAVDVARKVAQLRAKAKELADLEEHVRAGFDDTARHIKDKGLPPEILARHEEAVRTYEARAAEFKTLLAAVERASGPQLQTALGDLAAFMAKYPNQKTHTPTDPNNLPWGSPKPVTREPFTRPSQFRTSKLFGEPVRVAQAGSLSGISLPSTTLPATPNAVDLAATEDAQITQPIRDLAASLNNNPVQIYNWVRNNIEFVPSYGSIQGSDMTLQTKRGNSFDTASLLIALLRAANIPARYVYGTIEVPADKVMNWVGGVTVPRAAQDLLWQGGIPNIGLVAGGRVERVRLEHVWVEAFVDFVPSRGAVHRDGDTWIPLDASFKQYQFSAGMDLPANIPVDAAQLVAQVQAGATLNAQEGWVQNLNQSAVQQAMSAYQTQLLAYVDAQGPNKTRLDTIAGRAPVVQSPPILFGTLPYQVLVSGAKFQSMPENLRWKFRYSVYASSTERAFDEPMMRLERSTPLLAGKKITLSYSPAGAADAATLVGLLPAPHADGTPIQPSEVPRTLPAYLVRVVPELKVDGQTVANGPAFTLGTELVQSAAYFNPASGQWENAEDNRPIVGEYIATALSLQGHGAGEAAALAARLQSTEARLRAVLADPSDTTTLLSIGKEDLTGDLLYGTIFAYFAAINTTAETAARLGGGISYRMPSFGNFGVAARPSFFFGIVRSISFPTFQMDVDRILGIEVAKNGDANALLAMRRVLGQQYSANEHLIPEQLFPALDGPQTLPAVSAVKAIAMAGSQGQRIYALSPSNPGAHASALAQLAIDESTKSEIANALAVGREVTVHSAPVAVNGFVAVGYIIIDPQTGAGAYKISGGANGAAQSNSLAAGIEALLGLVVPSAYAAGGSTAVEIGTLLFKAFGLQSALDRALAECANPLEVANLLMAAFVFSVLLGLGAAFLALGPAALAFPWMFAIISIVVSILVSYLLEVLIFSAYCRRIPQN